MAQKKKSLILRQRKRFRYLITYRAFQVKRFNKRKKFKKYRVLDKHIYIWYKNIKAMLNLKMKYQHQNKSLLNYTYILNYKFKHHIIFNYYYLDSNFWKYSNFFLPYKNKYTLGINYILLNNTEECKDMILLYDRDNIFFRFKNIIYNNKIIISQKLKSLLIKNSKNNLFFRSFSKIFFFFFKLINLLYYSNLKKKNKLLNFIFILYFFLKKKKNKLNKIN